MKIDITFQRIPGNSQVKEQVIWKTRLALGRFTPVIQKIKISIADVNVTTGGMGTRCVVKVKLVNTGEIITHGQGEDISSALNASLPRACRTIARTLERKRETALKFN